MRLSLERVTYLAFFVVMVILYWQARGLASWGVLGPGAGLFPQITTGLCAILAATLAIFPKLGRRRGGGGPEPEAPMGPREKRLFWIYCAALPFIAFAAAFLGFISMSIIVVMALTWWAERGDWRHALLFGVLGGLVGVVVFGVVLEVTMPTDPLDAFVSRLLR